MRGALIAAALGAALAAAACEGPARPGKHRAGATFEAKIDREPLEPLPDPPAEDARLVALGRRLFADKRLSRDGSVACASCHELEAGGADHRRRSIGAGGREGAVNAPTVYNAGLNFELFWDGRAATLEDQIDEALANPSDFDSSWAEALPKLAADADYRAGFSALSKDGVTKEAVKRAIAAFERTLVTKGSRFDRWLAGDAGAMTADEREGYETFKSVGCVACHQGRNVGGNMLQRFGVFGDYFADRGDVTPADQGRYNVTHDEADRFVFRVPSLRCAAHTPPYFHDGSQATLGGAVQVMARYQLGRTLSEREVATIVAFLGALGECGTAGGGG